MIKKPFTNKKDGTIANIKTIQPRCPKVMYVRSSRERKNDKLLCTIIADEIKAKTNKRAEKHNRKRKKSIKFKISQKIINQKPRAIKHRKQ